jgi:hypothetical protein
VFGIRELRPALGHMRKEAARERGKLYIEEFHDLYS